MEKIEIDKIIEEARPGALSGRSYFLKKIIIRIFEKIFKVGEINRFIENHNDKMGTAFIDEIFEYLDFSYAVSDKDKRNIPSEGRLIIAANHPLGGLDGLALIKAIKEVRDDVKIVANNILSHIDNLKDIFLPINVYSNSARKENVIAVERALKNEEAVIIFPAGEVSRLRFYKISDKNWNKGAVFFAKKFNAPILPVYIKARNSIVFYLISMLNKNFSTLLLPRELFNKYGKTIRLTIGRHISENAFHSSYLKEKIQIALLRKHVYQIGKGKRGYYITERNIVHPVDKKELKREIVRAKELGSTNDGKKIAIVSYSEAPNVVKEIGRLREITFRKVGEGTGYKIDLDRFDKYYKHIALWDEQELEIVGAYRIGVCDEILAQYGRKGLYTFSLFNYSEELISKYLINSIELGRSFVQKKYWNTQALDYLWQGIGAFLADNPSIKYMYGPVSVSRAYKEEAKNMLVYFFNKWFPDAENLGSAKNPYIISKKNQNELEAFFTSYNYADDMLKLKSALREYGLSIPPLYKHYVELCERGGARFIDFGIDKDFSDCIDGLILIDIEKIKESKRERYINRFYSKTQIREAVNF